MKEWEESIGEDAKKPAWRNWERTENSMEIERKFLIGGYPGGTPDAQYEMEQGYLATEPTVVRIRRESCGAETAFVLCCKGKGTLAREEIEMDLEKDTYQKLLKLLPVPPVRKQRRDYILSGGLRLECNLVEPGAADSFYYAEVEFPTVEAAEAFDPPAWLGKEVTGDPSFTMKRFWERRCEKAKK